MINLGMSYLNYQRTRKISIWIQKVRVLAALRKQ